MWHRLTVPTKVAWPTTVKQLCALVLQLLLPGGTVVHMSSGYAALIAAVYLGRRMKSPVDQESGMFQDIQEPANVPIVMLGTAFLWFGWFGVSSCFCLAVGWNKLQAWPTPCLKAPLLLHRCVIWAHVLRVLLPAGSRINLGCESLQC
jgi:hypothetical protein